jgi:hypothetical protein
MKENGLETIRAHLGKNWGHHTVQRLTASHYGRDRRGVKSRHTGHRSLLVLASCHLIWSSGVWLSIVITGESSIT